MNSRRPPHKHLGSDSKSYRRNVGVRLYGPGSTFHDLRPRDGRDNEAGTLTGLVLMGTFLVGGPALVGAGVSGLFAMALVLPADIAPRGRTGAAAGMVLAVGYGTAALGPVIAGVVRDVTGSFAVTLLLLPAVGATLIVLGAIAPELPHISGSVVGPRIDRNEVKHAPRPARPVRLRPPRRGG